MTVEMTSSGYYDYKYNGIIYRIKNAVINPSSNYGDTLNGRNEDYINISNAAPLFSPYTTWTIRLIDHHSKLSDRSTDYHAEKALQSNVDLIMKTNVNDPTLYENLELHFVGVGSCLKQLSFARSDDSDGSRTKKDLYSEVKISKDYEACRISSLISS
jgi:hypothetical protein